VSGAIAQGPIRTERLDGGAIWRVRLGGARGSVLDAPAVAALTGLFRDAAQERSLKAVCLAGEGAHFSFGASVEEHLPGQVERMLPAFHGLFRALFDSCVFVHAAVRGRCLGGGLELALAGHRIAAAPDAALGQPEILLGVLAPVASLLLPERVGRPRAEDMCLSGRTVDAAEALSIGLVDEIAADPEEAALAWLRKHLLPRSASSLRLANRAVRAALRRRLDQELAGLEALYLGPLMETRDAEEGLRAFLEKRAPVWRNE
jgi:cyclohexa-1,5-dienecarbonyl-CoA hydratase